MLTCDPIVRDTMAVLANPLDAFQNPLTSRIGSLNNLGWSLKDQLIDEIANPGPKPPEVTQMEWDARLVKMAELQDVFTNVFASPGDYANASIGQLKSYTDFMSGTNGFSGSFPTSVLSGAGAGIAGTALLAGATFMSVISVASGSKLIGLNTCRIASPSLPIPEVCEGTRNVFAMVMGAYNSIIDGLNSGLAVVTSFINMTASNLQALQLFINTAVDKLIAGIVAEITKLVSLLTEALAYGMAKLMQNMSLDPCTLGILQTVGKPALLAALQVTAMPNAVLPLNIPTYL